MKTHKMEVTYDPVKKIKVHEVTYLEREDLLGMMAFGTPVGQFGRGLFWNDGVAFTYSVLPWNDETIAEYVRGTMHVNSVIYTDWPEFKPQVEVKSKGAVLPGVQIPFWDTSTQPHMVAIAKFLKTTFEGETK